MVDFYVLDKTIYLHGWADLDYDTVNSYVVTLWVNDGTETTTTTLTIDLIEHIVLLPSMLNIKYSQTCIKRSPFGQRESGLMTQVFSMTGQDNGDLLIQVTA